MIIPEDFHHRPNWEIPGSEPRGDSDASSVYNAVGFTLRQWELCEVELSRLFSILVRSDSEAAVRAYGGLASATARTEAQTNAADIFFDENTPEILALYRQFKIIVQVMRNASPRRNDIAHGIVQRFAEGQIEHGGYYLFAPIYNTRRNDPDIDFSKPITPLSLSSSRYAYTSAQIMEYASRFQLMAREIGNFCRLIRKTLRSARQEINF